MGATSDSRDDKKKIIIGGIATGTFGEKQSAAIINRRVDGGVGPPRESKKGVIINTGVRLDFCGRRNK